MWSKKRGDLHPEEQSLASCDVRVLHYLFLNV